MPGVDDDMDKWCEVCCGRVVANGFFSTCGHIFCNDCFTDPSRCPKCFMVADGLEGFKFSGIQKVPVHLHSFFTGDSVHKIHEFQNGHYKKVAARAVQLMDEQKVIINDLKRKLDQITRAGRDGHHSGADHLQSPAFRGQQHYARDGESYPPSACRSPDLLSPRKGMASPGGIISTPAMHPRSHGASRPASPARMGPPPLPPATPSRSRQQSAIPASPVGGLAHRSQSRPPPAPPQRDAGRQFPAPSGLEGARRGVSASPRPFTPRPGTPSNSALVAQRFGPANNPPGTPRMSSMNQIGNRRVTSPRSAMMSPRPVGGRPPHKIGGAVHQPRADEYKRMRTD